jgi:predicted porin
MKLSVSLYVALAVVGSSSVSRPVLAETAPDAPAPLFEIYGTFIPYVEFAQAAGATAQGTTGGASQVSPALISGAGLAPRFRMDANTSNLGFRGGVDLNDGLAVVWQLESGVPVDGNPSANTIASRNSQLGLKGAWGTVFYGNWDTPFKWTAATTINPIRAGFISDYNGILSSPGFGVTGVVTQPGRVAGAADAAFERRVGNSLQYWSPNISGFAARLEYSFDKGRTTRTPTAPSIQPSLFSGSLAYDIGPLKLRYGFDAHIDYFGMSPIGGSPGDTLTNTSSLDTGHRVIASYTHAAPGFDTRITGAFEYLSWKSEDTTPNAVKEHARSAFWGTIDQTVFGKSHVWASFGLAGAGSCAIVGGAPCSTKGLGANMAELGYIYRFSKDTDLYAVAYRLTNDDFATYATFTPLGVTAAGADISSFGIGMLHSFTATVLKGSHRGAPVPDPGLAPSPARVPETAPTTAPVPAPPPDPSAAPAPAPAPPRNP